MQLVKWMWFRRWSLMSPFTSLRILFRTALVILRTSMPPPRQSISVDKETNHRVSHSPKFEFSWPDPAGTSRVLLKPSQNLPGNEAEIRQPHRLPMTNETLISLKSLFFLSQSPQLLPDSAEIRQALRMDNGYPLQLTGSIPIKTGALMLLGPFRLLGTRPPFLLPHAKRRTPGKPNSLRSDPSALPKP